MALPSIDDIKALAGGAKRETDEYEVRGVVTKIGGDTVFVRFEGSDIETPVDASCANVKVGDEVSVHVSHDDTHIVGNRTDPSATTSQMEQVNSRVSIIDSIIEVVESAVSVVSSSISVINSRIRVRDNVLEFLDELGGIVAAFGERIRLGNADAAHVDLDEDSLDFSVGDSTVASYGVSKIQLGNNANTSRIEFCDNRAYLSAGTNGIGIYANGNSSTTGMANIRMMSPKTTSERGYGYMQFWKGSDATAGVSTASDGVYLYGGANGVYVTDSWRDDEISSNSHRRLALTAGLFAETTTTVIDGVTVASGGSVTETASAVAPSGGTWYPLCISSWYAGSRYELLARARLTGKGANKCTINIAIQNTSSASRACSMDIYVLWARMY